MTEVEVKLPVKDMELLKQFLQKEDFRLFAEVIEEDLYFDNEKGEYEKSGKALRIRQTTDCSTGEESSRITWKGERLDTFSMTRRELETHVSDGGIMKSILNSLGFFAAGPMVKKHRYLYQSGGLTLCLDKVYGLGDFMELEILADEAETDAAYAEIGAVLERMGCSFSDSITDSYYAMLKVKQEGK